MSGYFSNPHPNIVQQQQKGSSMNGQRVQVPILQKLPNGLIQLPNGQQVTEEQAQALINSGALHMMVNNPNMNMARNMPMNMGMPMNQGMPMNMGMPMNQGMPMYSGMPMNQGMPMNMGMPMNQGMPMYGEMQPMQVGSPINTNRFGSQSQPVFGQISAPASQMPNTTTESRFSPLINNTGVQAMQQQSPTEKCNKTFSISVSKGFMFDNNSNVILSSFYDEIRSNQILVRQDKFTLTSCFEEAVEVVAEHAHEESNGKLAIIGTYLVENKFYKTTVHDKLNEIIAKDDIKAIYKAVKALWPELKSKYDIHLVSSFDTILTNEINDFLAINSPELIYIDSFMTDFNDTLKFIRNLSSIRETFQEYLEDELVSYLNFFVSNIKNGIEYLKQINEEEGSSVVRIPKFYNIGYVDKYSFELGIANAPSDLTMIEENAINKFLLSYVEFVFESQDTNVCYMVTIDKHVIKLARNLGDKVFIKSLGQR